MALAVNIPDEHGLSNEMGHELQPKKSSICCSLHGKRHLTSCILLTRHSSSVLKVGVPCGL